MNKNIPKRQIKFRFFNPPGKSFVTNYNYRGSVDELFEQDDMLIPSQFTGFVDSNGKDVYEGDIIELAKNGFGEIKKGIIEYKKGAFVVSLINTQSTLNFIFMYQLGSFSIIGNIFENDN